MDNHTKTIRPAHLCRSWLFINGADENALKIAPESGADVLIQELEDFTPAALRPKARQLAQETYREWRSTGAVVAVRVNPLEGDGMADLEAVMHAAPDIVALPKVSSPQQVIDLDREITRLEVEYSLPAESTLLLPNIELAAGLVRTLDIAMASKRIAGCLLASEDLAADLDAERSKEGIELAYCRQRFIVECTAANTLAIDGPYTWQDHDGVEQDTSWARRLGYKAKSAVAHSHAEIINTVLTPSPEDVRQAKQIIEAFEKAQSQGLGRVELDGSLIETPIYLTAKRLVARASALDSVPASPAN